MNRLDPNTQTISLVPLPASSDSALANTRRIIVIIAGADEENELVFRILSVAKPLGLAVLLLGICPGPLEESELRRSLITMAAFLRDAGLSTEIRIEYERGWVEKMKAIQRPGDMLACYERQNAWPQLRPLSQVLTSASDAPLYIFTKLHASRPTRLGFLSQAVSWVGSVAIIAGFFWLQIKVSQSAAGWVTSSLLIVSVLTEVGLIWFWNSLFG